MNDAVTTPPSPNTHHDTLAHVVPLKMLLGVFAALLCLTWITVAVTWFDFGNFNLYIALCIAFVKATLVVLYFMHLRWDKGFNVIVFVGCLLFVTLFISFALTDTRQYAPSRDNSQAPGMKDVHQPLTPENTHGTH